MAALPEGAACSKCLHYSYAANLPGWHCALDSDWEGFVRVKPEHVCPRFSDSSSPHSSKEKA